MPKMFVGSSVEGLPVARAIRSNLEHDAQVTVWNEGVFRLSRHNRESISQALDETDFGVFVFTPDDVTVLRGEEWPSVRDNVILELGMFIGRLGGLRTFIVQPRGVEYHLPTDLLGITLATYEPARDNLQDALGSACDQIRRELDDHRSRFPDSGSFGPNILAEDAQQLDADREYSLAVDVPHGIPIEVEIVHEEHEPPQRVPWAMRVGPARRIDHDVQGEGRQRFWNTEPGRAETPVKFADHGSVTITVCANGEVLNTKRLTW